ncbi:unnamed protein product [Owenia fusiformis]|uniref:RRM domain-containing protein n=1 Tax=Owenia fusiformis TaxID=6347 RepID=A0A8S4NNA6_OWEFU|nr:unnamed protein product [Owenia fusiformis]
MSYNGGGSEDISAKVFVAGLSRSITERDLKDSFEKYGPIKEVRVVMDRATQESKGFGFVTYEEIRDAEDAIAGMDNRDLDGRTVHCAKAKPKREGGDRRGGGGGYGGGGYGGGNRSYGGGDRGYGGGEAAAAVAMVANVIHTAAVMTIAAAIGVETTIKSLLGAIQASVVSAI